MKNSVKTIALALAMLCVCSLCGCLTYSSNILDVTRPVTQTPSTNRYVPSTYPQYSSATTTLPNNQIPSSVPFVSENEPTSAVPASDIPTTLSPALQEPSSQTPPTAPAKKEPTAMSKEELVQYVNEAVNKTRAFTGKVSANHTDEFNINITKITGGSAVMAIANPIVDSLTKPAHETLNYSGGKAKDSEGNYLPMLLPKNGNFSLTAAQCKSITASKSGNNTVVKITLVTEVVGLGETPAANATTAGFLDVATLDLNAVTITNLKINYSGTELTYTINPNGYVAKAVYHIPLSIVGAGKVKLTPISANLEASGYEDEVFEFKW